MGYFQRVQMFVINLMAWIPTYFSAANDSELRIKIYEVDGLDKDNNAVSNYIEFAKAVLSIPGT